MTTATQLTEFVFSDATPPQVGDERYVVTRRVGGEDDWVASRVDVPVNNKGFQCVEGWLGSWTSGGTTADRYAHGLRKAISVTPSYGWDCDLDRPEETPFGYEVVWG
jgi:hypothetical protein